MSVVNNSFSFKISIDLIELLLISNYFNWLLICTYLCEIIILHTLSFISLSITSSLMQIKSKLLSFATVSEIR